MARVCVAGIQMSSGDDVAVNLRRARRYLTAAAGEGAQLAVLPENFALMSQDERARAGIAERNGRGPLQEFLATCAAELKLWVVGGTIPLRSRDPARPYAASCVYDASGQRVGRYDKLHLFDVRVPDSREAYLESASTTPGRAPLVTQTPWGRLGVAVCYDLRFPELFRRMSSGGLDLLAVPAAFTRRTGAAHWETLLRARAIENLCYVAAAAQTGAHPGGRQTWGHSMVIDPWGAVVAAVSTRPGLVLARIDTGRLGRLREQFPVLEHRRPGLARG